MKIQRREGAGPRPELSIDSTKISKTLVKEAVERGRGAICCSYSKGRSNWVLSGKSGGGEKKENDW